MHFSVRTEHGDLSSPAKSRGECSGVKLREGSWFILLEWDIYLVSVQILWRLNRGAYALQEKLAHDPGTS